MTILCAPDQQLAGLLERGTPDDTRMVTNLPDVAMAMAHDPAQHLVVIGSQVALDPALSLSGHLREERPDATVILMRDELDPDTIARATAAGVHEVVPAGQPQALNDALDRAERSPWLDTSPAPVAEQPMGKVITVFAAKGGCGKTTVSTNLAVALNANGTRPVCLIDLDLAFGDVAISMQLQPKRSLVDAVAAGGHLVDKIDDLITPYRPGLDCILAPVVPGDAEKIPSTVVDELLVALRQRYLYIVVDTPSQFSEHVLAALDASHHHVLLTTAEIPAMKNLRLTLDMLDLLTYRREARSIILNRSDARGGLNAHDVENAIKAPIATQIPASHEVPASINRGIPIVDALPDHPVSRAIRSFAEYVIVGERAERRKHERRHGERRSSEWGRGDRRHGERRQGDRRKGVQ